MRNQLKKAVVINLFLHIIGILSSPILVKTCASYKAINSANADKRYCSCVINLCENQYLTIDSCGMCSGDPQYLRIYSANNTRLIDGYGGYGVSSCAPCARVNNFRPIEYGRRGCQTFTIREGCFGSGSCAATVKLYVSNISIPLNVSYSPTIAPITAPVSITMISSSPAAYIASFLDDLVNYFRSNFGNDSYDEDELQLSKEVFAGSDDIFSDATASSEAPFPGDEDRSPSPVPIHSMRRRRGRTKSSSSSTSKSETKYAGYCGYKRSLDAGVVAGVAIGVTFGVIILVAIIFIFMRWKRAHDKAIVPVGYHSTHVTAKEEMQAEIAYATT